MLDHHIQRSIVYHLAFADSMRFSELQPDDIDSKLFTYHLKKVIASGLVIKTPEGLYALTPEGRRVGKGALKKQTRFIDRAYSVLFLVVRRKSDDGWLLCERKSQPLIGLKGLMNAQPNALEECKVTAQKICFEKTGLRGEFSTVGSGYFRIYRDSELESFTHFTLMYCDDIQGKIMQQDELAEYFWSDEPDFEAQDMLPTMPSLISMYKGTSQKFIEQTFRL